MNIISFNRSVVNDHGYFNRRRNSYYSNRISNILTKKTSCFTKTTSIVKKHPYSSATSTFIYLNPLK